MLGEPAAISTSPPGHCSSPGATSRQPSTMLSDTLAAASGETPSGRGVSMRFENGTRTSSDRNPPQSPPNEPNPYMERKGTLSQLPVSPRRQCSHSPHEIWNGTLTSAPDGGPASAAPATSATHSWPTAIGGSYGVSPAMIGASRSQVATASGRTSASRPPSRSGSSTSSH